MKELSVTPSPEIFGVPKVDTPISKSLQTTAKTEKIEPKIDKDKPFPADYFNVPDWGSLITQPEIDVHSMKDKVIFIESYIMERLSDRDMKTDRNGIYDALKEIEHQIGVDDKFQPHARINKVFDYLNTLKTQSILESERKRKIEALLKKP